jgi:UDP-N-acetyl-D-mannosaminuronic acid transferase (WecB/TagA/CpsF family)
MSNVTLSINENDLKQARILALHQGTSLNAIIRKFIKNYVNRNTPYQQITERLLERSQQLAFDSGNKKWTREDLYER